MDCSLPGTSVHRDSLGKDIGVGCHALLQGIFPTQGSNPGLPHYRQIPYQLSFQGSLWATQFSSVAQSCLTLCNPMNCSTPGFPVHYQLPEPTQTHVHRVGDVIQSSHLCCPLVLLPLIFPRSRVFSNESFFASGGQNIGASASESVLPMNIQD